MKSKNSDGRRADGARKSQNRNQSLAKAAMAERLVTVAREHWRTLKFEQKQARKAFKQAKKAAKLARKEAGVELKEIRAYSTRLAKAAKARLTRLKPHKAQAERAKAPIQEESQPRSGNGLRSSVPPTMPEAEVSPATSVSE